MLTWLTDPVFDKKNENFEDLELNVWKPIAEQQIQEGNTLALEEKQVLLESKNLSTRKEKLEEIIKTYIVDNFSNSTLQ